jgi:hypothetical protein
MEERQNGPFFKEPSYQSNQHRHHNPRFNPGLIREPAVSGGVIHGDMGPEGAFPPKPLKTITII